MNDWQHTIILYALLTNNTLISFDHALCKTSNFWSSLRISSLNLFLSALHFALKTSLVAFCLAFRYFSLLWFPCFHSLNRLCFSVALLTSSFYHHVSLVSNRDFSSSATLAKYFLKSSNNHQQRQQHVYYHSVCSCLAYELKLLFALSSCSSLHGM